MKPLSRAFMLVLLGCALVSIGMATTGNAGKWLTSAGLLIDVAGIVQLEISGLFDDLLREYGDDERYPYGPPSHITRHIIDNPDTPMRIWVRNRLFFQHRTGFELIVIGFFFQLAGVWT